MGQIVQLKCRECNFVWQHYEGVGFEAKPLHGTKNPLMTGDADPKVCCPQCGSTNYEPLEDGVVMMWD